MDITMPISAAMSDIAEPYYPKRVTSACDYCRAKRLKCTHNERPCMNCRLYGVECKNTKGPRSRRANKSPARKRSKRKHAQSTNTPDTASGSSNSQQSIAMADGQSTWPENEDDSDMEVDNTMDNTGNMQQNPLPNEMHNFYQNDLWKSHLPLHDSIFLGRLIDPHNTTIDQPQSNHTTARQDTTLSAESNETSDTVGVRTPSGDHCKGKVSSIHALQQQSAEVLPSGQLLPGLFVSLSQVDIGFIGLTSTGATLALCIRESRERYTEVTSAITFDWLVQVARHINRISTSWLIDVSVDDLPPKSLATSSIAAYFSNVHIFYPFVRMQEFQASWGDLYRQNKTQHRSVDYLLFCMIVAVGALSDRRLSESGSQLDRFSNALYEQAWSLLSASFSEPSISTVQVLLLYTIFIDYNGQGSTASILCGLIIRLCQGIGLHRRSPDDFDLPEEEIKYRSQLWWIAYSLEASLSMSEGRPTSVAESTHDVELMPLCRSTYSATDMAGNQSRVFYWKVRLAQIRHKFCRICSRSASITERLKAFTGVDVLLRQWRDGLPPQYRPEQGILADPEIYQLIAVLHLEYFNLLRAIHWVSITLISTGKGIIDENLSRHIRTSEVICMEAARSFIKTLNDIVDESIGGRVFAVGLQIHQHIAALAILYRGICKEPQRLSAKADLENFRVGKQHLERDTFPTSLSLALTPVFDDMLRVVENLVLHNNTRGMTASM